MPSSKISSLTPRQRDIYDFLRDKILNRGYGPTVREIGSNFGIRSPNGVMCHLKALEKKGLITRESHMSRAIQLVDRPRRTTSLPLKGQMSSGRAITSAGVDARVDFDELFDSEDLFCVQAEDNSMVSEGISHGDYLIARQQAAYQPGGLVIALNAGRNATLMRHAGDLEVLGALVGVIRRVQVAPPL